MEMITELISKFGVSGIVLVIIYFVIRLKPITLLTANPIELKFMSKEMRFSIKAVKVVWEFMLSFLLLFLLSFVFVEWRLPLCMPYIVISFVIILVSFLVILYLTEIKKKFLNIHNKPVKTKTFYIVSYMIYVANLYILPAYFLGSSLDVDLKELTNIQLLALLILLSILILFITAPVNYIMKKTFIFIDTNPNNSNSINNKPVYIIRDRVKWYIYHPIDDKYIYLANAPSIEASTKFTFIEKDKLAEEILIIDHSE